MRTNDKNSKQITKMFDRMSSALNGHSEWDGRKCCLEMKEQSESDGVNYGWRQMEWQGFYLEYLLRQNKKTCLVKPTNMNTFSGQFGGHMAFDFYDTETGAIVEVKVHDSNSKPRVILNDLKAMEDAITKNGFIMLFIVSGSATKDDDGSFKQWQDELKGKKSDYIEKRNQESEKHGTCINTRIRKSAFKVENAAIYIIDNDTMHSAAITYMNQGRNYNSRPRPPKACLDLDNIAPSAYMAIPSNEKRRNHILGFTEWMSHVFTSIRTLRTRQVLQTTLSQSFNS